MKFKRGIRAEKGWIDFVPFLNITFLINFFLLLTSSLAFQPGIKVDVPYSGVIDLEKEKDTAIVTISKDKRIFLNEKWLSASDMKTAMQTFMRENPAKLIVIKADSNVRHDCVVAVMNMIIESGIRRISIAARPGGNEGRTTKDEGRGTEDDV